MNCCASSTDARADDASGPLSRPTVQDQLCCRFAVTSAVLISPRSSNMLVYVAEITRGLAVITEPRMRVTFIFDSSWSFEKKVLDSTVRVIEYVFDFVFEV